MAERDKGINTVGAATSASPSGRESAGPPLPSSQPLNGPTPHPVRSKTTKLTIDQYRHKTNKASFSSLSEPGSSKGQALGEVSSGDGPSSRPPSSMPNFGSAGSRGVVPPPLDPRPPCRTSGRRGHIKGWGYFRHRFPYPPLPRSLSLCRPLGRPALYRLRFRWGRGRPLGQRGPQVVRNFSPRLHRS